MQADATVPLLFNGEYCVERHSLNQRGDEVSHGPMHFACMFCMLFSIMFYFTFP